MNIAFSDLMKTMRDHAPHSGDPWTATRVVEAVFFVLFLSIQTAVPLVKLWAPRPARFGWQMFSGRQERARFSLVMRDGTSRPVNLALYLAQSRGEMDPDEALPQHLCRVVPDVASVQVTAPGSKASRVYKCP